MPVKFSILVPTYNAAAHLSKLLDSLVQQNCKDFELLIQDAGSTDQTLTILTAYKERLPAMQVFSEQDRGIYDAMNNVQAKAKGEWLIFMGSDDNFYAADTLSKVAQFTAKTTAKVVYGDVVIKGNTNWAKDGQRYDGPFDLPKLLNQNICHQAIFYNKAFVTSQIGPYNTAYAKSADWDYNLRCWALQPMVYMDQIIAEFAAGGFSSESTDHALESDFVTNLTSYFKLDLFDPQLNTPKFVYFNKVKALQRQKHPLRFKWERLKDFFINRKSKP